MRSYRPEELFDEAGALRAELAALAPAGSAPDGRQPARQRRAAAGRAGAAGLPRLRGRRSRRRPPARREATRVLGDDAARRDRPQPRPLPADGAGRDGVEPADGRVRGHRPRLGGRDARHRRSPRARRPGDGGAVRASLPGLARGLPADRPPRPVQLLRGVHPHHRRDVQPAREVAEGDAADPVAAADRVAELSAVLARLAPGPQRLLPPGPGLHRPRRQQEGRDRPRLPAAGRQLPAVGRRPLPAQPRLRQRDRRRQAAGARLPDHGGGDRALHPRARDLGVGLQRRRRRARRGAGLRRRRADARDGRGRCAAARASAAS